MRTLLLWLCIHPVYTVFEGTCPRKDPPPGVLVLSPGSKLVLTCSGHMKVDGVSVGVIGESSTANTRRKSSSVTTTTQKYTSKAAALIRSDNSSVRVTTSSHLTKTQTSSDSGENRSLRYAEAGFTLSPHMDPAARPSTSLQRESDWEPQSNLKGEGDNKVTRGIKLWKWNKNRIGAGDKDWEDVTFGRSGHTLTLASVRPADSGKYTCYHKKRENFAVKVIVADPPERPSLSCYKKSPSSKIRCEWSAQKPITKHPDCYLLLSKGLSYNFSRVLCSYLSHHARCWCALDYNEDELRTPHVAFLCVTSMTQNATSSILNFTPLDILRPDPPSNVSVQQKEGQERRMKISWNFPLSWKQQDQFYYLIYEIKYRPVSGDEDQIIRIKVQRSYTITDVIPGIKYVIQLRSKEEYDGQWSQWSTPVYAQTWNAKLNPPSKVSVQVEEGQETMMTVTWISPTDWKHEDCHHELIYEIKYQILGFLIDDGQTRTIKGHCIYTITDVIPGAEYMIQVRTKKGHGGDWSDWSTPVYAGSWTTISPPPSTEGSGDVPDYSPEDGPPVPVLHHFLWVSVVFAILAIIFIIFIFRLKERLMSKLHNLNVITLCGDISQPPPSVQTPPEGQALVTFAPPPCQGKPSEAEAQEKEEEETMKERREATHFNNSIYFFIPRES